MRLSIIVIISIISFLFLGHREDNSGNQPNKKVTFKLEKTFGAESKPVEAILSSVRSIEFDKKNNLYLIDKGRFLSFDQSGKVRWCINKTGKGPGDIFEPQGFACDGAKYLYLSNNNGLRIDKFDLNGKFLNTLKLSDLHLNYLHILGFIKPNLLVTYISISGKIASEIIIMEVDKNFAVKKRFLIDRTGESKLPAFAGIGFGLGISDNMITAGNTNEYKLEFYDINGNCIKRIRRDFRRIYTYYTTSNGVGCLGGIDAPVRFGKSHYICTLSFPSNVTEQSQLQNNKFEKEFVNFTDIFDDAGNLIYSKQSKGFVDEESGSVLGTDNDGYFYMSKDLPYPQICKYKVIIEDKK